MDRQHLFNWFPNQKHHSCGCVIHYNDKNSVGGVELCHKHSADYYRDRVDRLEATKLQIDKEIEGTKKKIEEANQGNLQFESETQWEGWHITQLQCMDTLFK